MIREDRQLKSEIIERESEKKQRQGRKDREGVREREREIERERRRERGALKRQIEGNGSCFGGSGSAVLSKFKSSSLIHVG